MRSNNGNNTPEVDKNVKTFLDTVVLFVEMTNMQISRGLIKVT